MACYQFQNNGSCKFGENCRFSHNAEGEDPYPRQGGGAPGGGGWGGRPQGGAPGAYGAPPRSRGVCYNFQETGDCKYGDRCRFAHGEEGGAEENKAGGYQNFSGAPGAGAGGYQRSAGRSRGTCFTFRDQGSCSYGDECRFSHDLSGGGAKPAGGGDSICYKFRDTGFCTYGDECRFSHETEAALPAPDAIDGQPAEEVLEAEVAPVAEE